MVSLQAIKKILFKLPDPKGIDPLFKEKREILIKLKAVLPELQR